jgi:hypothetical protein
MSRSRDCKQSSVRNVCSVDVDVDVNVNVNVDEERGGCVGLLAESKGGGWVRGVIFLIKVLASKTQHREIKHPQPSGSQME